MFEKLINICVCYARCLKNYDVRRPLAKFLKNLLCIHYLPLYIFHCLPLLQAPLYLTIRRHVTKPALHASLSPVPLYSALHVSLSPAPLYQKFVLNPKSDNGQHLKCFTISHSTISEIRAESAAEQQHTTHTYKNKYKPPLTFQIIFRFRFFGKFVLNLPPNNDTQHTHKYIYIYMNLH